MISYKIHEIFESVQGEGAMAGTPMLFVRFHGCNLKCSFCDTPQEKVHSTFGNTRVLLNRINQSELKWVCFTGGEPGLQLKMELISSVHESGRKVAVETNGTIGANEMQWADYVTVSPKTKDLDPGWNDRPPNEIRLLYGEGGIVQEYMGVLGPNVFVSPVVHRDESGMIYTNKLLERTIEYISEAPNNQYMRLSVQLHKLLSIK